MGRSQCGHKLQTRFSHSVRVSYRNFKKMQNDDAFLEQFGEGGQYLRMSTAERLKLAGETKLNQGKKFVWCPKSEEAYVKGELLEVADGKAKIQRADGKEIVMKEEDMYDEQVNPAK